LNASRNSQASNFAVERTAGAHSLAAPVHASVSVIMRLRVVLAVLALALWPPLASGCSERAEGSPSYEAAVREIQRLPEVRAWQRYVAERPPAKVALLPVVDKQYLIQGRCYWSVTLYSDEGTHFHRWNTFYVK
jgi:hypothetical protein